MGKLVASFTEVGFDASTGMLRPLLLWGAGNMELGDYQHPLAPEGRGG